MHKSQTYVLPLAGLVIVLGITYVMDHWLEALRQSAFQNFAGTLKWLIPTDLAHLMAAGLLLALIWIFLETGTRIAALIYILIGLGLLFYLAAWIALADIIPLPYLEALVPGTSTSFASAMIAATGLYGLISKRFAPVQTRDS